MLVHQLRTDSLAARDLHPAVTLARKARSRLTRLVADAGDEEVSWAEIGRKAAPPERPFSRVLGLTSNRAQLSGPGRPGQG